MAFAQGSRSRLAYGVESTFGTAASTYTNLPFNTHSLNLTKDRVAGNEIQPDRMPRVDRHGNRQTAGDIVVDLRDGDYDDLIESAMLSTFDGVSGTIKVGTTPKFLTIEDYAEDIDIARLFTGCAVNTMAVSLAPNQMVTTTFGLVGKDMNPAITAGSFITGEVYEILTVGNTDFTLIGAASNTVGLTFTATGAGSGTGTARISFSAQRTVSPSSGAAPFDSYSGGLAIGNVGASSNVAIVTGMDFTLTNSFAPTFVIGDDSAPSLEYGMAAIEGTLSAYFEDASLINRFLNETETELQVSVNDPTGTNAYTFLFPRVKINSADVGVDGPTSRVISLSFVALYDSTEGTNLSITRPT